jgi:protein involved in polysaccharide export with SLBB domain
MIFLNRYIAFILIFLMSFEVFSQNISLSGSDLSSVIVSELTDAQIKSFAVKVQEQNMSDQQLYAVLSSKGMDENEIGLLITRIKQYQEDPGSVFTPEYPFSDSDSTEISSKSGLTKPDDERAKIFGYNLFNSKNLSFEPGMNLPTPKNYIIGPGDELIIDIWGASEDFFQLVVNNQGTIRIKNLGPIYVNGLTVELAASRIKSRLTQIYSGLSEDKGSPNTFAQISLGNVRTIQVHIIGEIENPGSYNISGLSSVFNALYLSGGPNLNGSLRSVKIFRDSKLIEEFDIYDFLMNGISEQNIRLQDQDIIKIDPYNTRVEIEGEIKRPGIYEISKEESFEDLIRFSGGFTEKAYKKNLKVIRNSDKEKEIVTVQKGHFNDASPLNGDFVVIDSILNRFSNRVQISGAIYRPGEYELTEGMTMLDLINLGEGLRGDAFLNRATIYRSNANFTTQAITVDLNKLVNQEIEVELQNEDLVKISSIYELREEFYVEIKGEVRRPGIYPFLEKMTIEDAIFLAGGLRQSASINNLEISRRVKNIQDDNYSSNIAEIFNFKIDRNLLLNDENLQFELQAFDQLFIRKSPGYQFQETITVEGEVMYPGQYTLKDKNEKISDIIKRAGGVTPDAYVNAATLTRRSENYVKKTENEKRYEILLKLIKKYDHLFENTDLANESEQRRMERLNEYRTIFTEILTEDEIDNLLKDRERKLREILNDSTYFQAQNLKNIADKEEAIGIDLGAIIKEPGSKFDLFLEDGDVLKIPKEIQTVRLRGEVLYPITVRYDNRKSFMNYISESGGYSEEAKKGKSYVVHANGSVNRTKHFLFLKFYPNIEKGSTIYIPTRPPRQKMSVAQWTAVASGIVSLTLSVVVLSNSIKL